jgi:hypothetical protein
MARLELNKDFFSQKSHQSLHNERLLIDTKDIIMEHVSRTPMKKSKFF